MIALYAILGTLGVLLMLALIELDRHGRAKEHHRHRRLSTNHDPAQIERIERADRLREQVRAALQGSEQP